MRLLVLDHCRLLPWLARHELAHEVEIEAVADFETAERRLLEDPPDAALVSVPPAELPWRRFQHLCATRTPPVPVLYESCLHASAASAGLDPGDGYAAFLPKPAPRAELVAALRALLAAARPAVPAGAAASAPGSGREDPPHRR